MEAKQANTQDFQIKYLDDEEINDPLLVFRDFFSADWLYGHLEMLVEWRKYVIEDGYYTGRDDNPATLLYVHKLTVRLIEAAYLISKSKRGISLAGTVYIDMQEQLNQERKEWLESPTYLSKVEQINPYLTIANFFEFYSLDQYRNYLNEWLEIGLSAHGVDEELLISEVIYVYENLQKLYESAWIIRQRELEPVLKKEPADELTKTQELGQQRKGLSLIQANCTFNTEITEVIRSGLNQLLKIILLEVPSVKMIIYLGTYLKPDTYYLLVITGEKEKKPEHEIVNKIEDHCKRIINVFAIVHKADAFISALENGSRFFTQSLSRNKICYQASDLTLSQLKAVDTDNLKKEITTQWNRWGIQGKNFLDASLHAFDEENYNLSLFLMHQAVENTVSAIVRIMLGYRITVHNLTRLFRMTFLFTDDIRNIFDFRTEEDVQLFSLLQNGYSAARYKDDFVIDKETTKALSDRVCKVFIVTEGLYETALKSIAD